MIKIQWLTAAKFQKGRCADTQLIPIFASA